MKGIFMNINFNRLFQKLIPFIYIVLVAYILNQILFFYLPKSGVSFVENTFTNLEYKKYGFYSNIKIVEEKQQQINQQIQNLSKYNLKAIYSTNTNKGWISIEEKAGNTSYVLAQGEQIDGYVLFKLYKNYVIFQKDKKDYKLEIVETELSNYEDSKIEDIKTKNNGAVVSRDYLNSYITNMDKIWNNIAINEIKNGDKIDGFKIEKINKDSVFSKLGLKEGDIIKSVNNSVLGSYADAFKVYNDVGNIKYLNIEILRNNELMELSYEID